MYVFFFFKYAEFNCYRSCFSKLSIVFVYIPFLFIALLLNNLNRSRPRHIAPGLLSDWPGSFLYLCSFTLYVENRQIWQISRDFLIFFMVSPYMCQIAKFEKYLVTSWSFLWFHLICVKLPNLTNILWLPDLLSGLFLYLRSFFLLTK